MIIKILSPQIPAFWDAIKFAVRAAEEIGDIPQSYYNELLHALLSDKAQCFVALTNERALTGLVLTRLLVNKVNEEKFLYIEAFYLWGLPESKTWEDGYSLILKFAKKEDCKSIEFTSHSPSMWRRVEAIGFQEKTRTFTIKL